MIGMLLILQNAAAFSPLYFGIRRNLWQTTINALTIGQHHFKSLETLNMLLPAKQLALGLNLRR